MSYKCKQCGSWNEIIYEKDNSGELCLGCFYGFLEKEKEDKKMSCKKCGKKIEIADDGLCYECYDNKYWEKGRIIVKGEPNSKERLECWKEAQK
ncbi:hypothetical protein LCGC14_0923290 [marine sediment metagenome]|uniref:Uncharacterized protein n=1 Tax=marine sediment metagenome TaxID=412755 RepID=A0A0F9NUW9_9ZZZZ